jgi:hypothetical protein
MYGTNSIPPKHLHASGSVPSTTIALFCDPILCIIFTSTDFDHATYISYAWLQSFAASPICKFKHRNVFPKATKFSHFNWRSLEVKAACVCTHHTMKEYWVYEGKAPRNLDLGTRRRCVVSRMLRPLHPYTLYRRPVVPRNRVRQ